MIGAALAGLLIASGALAGETASDETTTNSKAASAAAPTATVRRGVTDIKQLDRMVREAFDQRDYAGAVEVLEEWRAERPKDPLAAYNLACARCMMGRADEAAELLLDAISFGFTDFRWMERDENLAGIREHAKYRLVLKGWRELLDARGEAEMSSMRHGFGTAYRYTRDETLRLNFASSFDERTSEEARVELVRVGAWARANVFGGDAANGTDAADEARPDPWVSVALPTPADFADLVGPVQIGGYYEPDAKRLITRDLGPGLRHEFFHALHWREMAKLGQHHPIWVMEGLASLVEDVDESHAGEMRPVPSWRTNIVGRMARAGRLTAWERLFAMPRERYMEDRASGNYAQARAVFLFLYEKGKLGAWWRAYTAEFSKDETGLGAIETAFGKGTIIVEEMFREWAKALPLTGDPGAPSDVSLGVELSGGAGDGPMVREVKHRYVDAAGMYLSPRDVIVGVEDRTVRTLDDLARIIGEYRVGDEVVLDIRRGKLRLRVRVELREPDEKEIW